ncbi:MAG: UTP--glucose-1-phosphate uridylyltransferase GalU [Rhodobacteraceae bacterium]|nr:UTP--glucose-1-phosphate uridylyltransferase GalU [Paracoccaceae bacterium]
MNTIVTKAIFPVAGLGTRFLPATKSIPKEIMTLVDRPLIQYAIDEAREAGITDFIFVTARGKYALEDYFDSNPELEKTLFAKGKTELLKQLRDTDMESGAIAYIRQREALGLGHAVWCARRLISPNEPFAVLLPDDVIAGQVGCLKQMVDAYQEVGGNMVATMEVASEQISNYGVIDPIETNGRIITAKGMVEKPNSDVAPSNLAVIGRYILRPEIFDALKGQSAGAGGEVQLTDAICAQIGSGTPVTGFRFDGNRFDCGSKAGYLQATVAFGLARPELHDEFRTFLDSITHMQRVAE